MNTLLEGSGPVRRGAPLAAALLLAACSPVTGAVTGTLMNQAGKALAGCDVLLGDAESMLFDDLIVAARKGSAETPRFLIRWMQHRHPDQLFHTAGDVVKFLGDDTLATELEHLQADLFAGQGRSDSGETDRQALVRALEQIRRRKPKTTGGDGLRPLYPDNLSA